jgi:hypothetical protein
MEARCECKIERVPKVRILLEHKVPTTVTINDGSSVYNKKRSQKFRLVGINVEWVNLE